MKKSVLITLKDSHTKDDDTQTYEITTHGTFDGDDDNYTIEYDEQYDDLKGCHTVLKITDGKSVSMIRSGSYNTEMTIEQGKRHSCQYTTPYGSFLIGIFASEVRSSVRDGAGKLEMKYTIDFYGGIASENELCFTLE